MLLVALVVLVHTFGMGFTTCAIMNDPDWFGRWNWRQIAMGVLFWEFMWGHGLYLGLVRGVD